MASMSGFGAGLPSPQPGDPRVVDMAPDLRGRVRHTRCACAAPKECRGSGCGGVAELFRFGRQPAARDQRHAVRSRDGRRNLRVRTRGVRPRRRAAQLQHLEQAAVGLVQRVDGTPERHAHRSGGRRACRHRHPGQRRQADGRRSRRSPSRWARPIRRRRSRARRRRPRARDRPTSSGRRLPTLTEIR